MAKHKVILEEARARAETHRHQEIIRKQRSLKKSKAKTVGALKGVVNEIK